MDWPIYYKDLIRIGNMKSQVGIVTLWTICDEIIKNIDSKLYCAAGQLYSKNGINYIVRNCLANKNLRYLILSGQDQAHTGEAMLNLWKTRSSNVLHKEIGKKALQNLIKNVKLVDLREQKDGQVIQKEVQKLDQNRGTYGRNETFPQPRKQELRV